MNLCQYVVVCFFLFQYADVAAYSYILNKKQLELYYQTFSVSMWEISISACRCITYKHNSKQLKLLIKSIWMLSVYNIFYLG